MEDAALSLASSGRHAPALRRGPANEEADGSGNPATQVAPVSDCALSVHSPKAREMGAVGGGKLRQSSQSNEDLSSCLAVAACSKLEESKLSPSGVSKNGHWTCGEWKRDVAAKSISSASTEEEGGSSIADGGRYCSNNVEHIRTTGGGHASSRDRLVNPTVPGRSDRQAGPATDGDGAQQTASTTNDDDGAGPMSTTAAGKTSQMNKRLRMGFATIVGLLEDERFSTRDRHEMEQLDNISGSSSIDNTCANIGGFASSRERLIDLTVLGLKMTAEQKVGNSDDAQPAMPTAVSRQNNWDNSTPCLDYLVPYHPSPSVLQRKLTQLLPEIDQQNTTELCTSQPSGTAGGTKHRDGDPLRLANLNMISCFSEESSHTPSSRDSSVADPNGPSINAFVKKIADDNIVNDTNLLMHLKNGRSSNWLQNSATYQRRGDALLHCLSASTADAMINEPKPVAASTLNANNTNAHAKQSPVVGAGSPASESRWSDSPNGVNMFSIHKSIAPANSFAGLHQLSNPENLKLAHDTEKRDNPANRMRIIWPVRREEGSAMTQQLRYMAVAKQEGSNIETQVDRLLEDPIRQEVTGATHRPALPYFPTLQPKRDGMSAARNGSSEFEFHRLLKEPRRQGAPSWPPKLQAEKCSINSTLHLRMADSTIGGFAGNGSKMKHTFPPQEQQAVRGRKVGRVRRYNEQMRAYGAWEDIRVSGPGPGPNNGSARIDLNRGGRVCLYTKLLPEEKQKTLSAAMHRCQLYRQYTRSEVFHEPRFHVLLSSKAHLDSGYLYHGIKMKSLSIDLIPEIRSYADELARLYQLPQNQWDIGVDLIIYKDGEDSIGWHADDTQGESVVLCVVVDAPGEPRSVKIRPNKRAKQLTDGDEEVQLYVGEGDAYAMDGKMQAGYEHSLPKKRDNKSHRFVLIFRHGDVASVANDSGMAITEMAERKKICLQTTPDVNKENLVSVLSKLRPKRKLVTFGHPQGVFEGSLYSRRFLYSINAHGADQRGVNGNIKLGSDSIVVSRQSPDCREEDGLQWLRYTSNRRQGGGALCLSHKRQSSIRVFRSSNLKSQYAPPAHESGRTSYRYDGLYLVTNIWDSGGNSMAASGAEIPAGGVQYTFHLERLPKLESPFVSANNDIQNSMSVDELWKNIQCSHGRPTAHFVPPCPRYHGALPKLQNTASGSFDSRNIVDSGRYQLHKKTISHSFAALSPLDKAMMKVQPERLDGPVRPTRFSDKRSQRWNRYRNEDRLASLHFHSFGGVNNGTVIRQPLLSSGFVNKPYLRSHPPYYQSLSGKATAQYRSSKFGGKHHSKSKSDGCKKSSDLAVRANDGTTRRSQKGAPPHRRCKAEGCIKYRATKCNGFCSSCYVVLHDCDNGGTDYGETAATASLGEKTSVNMNRVGGCHGEVSATVMGAQPQSPANPLNKSSCLKPQVNSKQGHQHQQGRYCNSTTPQITMHNAILNRNTIEMVYRADPHVLGLLPGGFQPKRIFESWLKDRKNIWKKQSEVLRPQLVNMKRAHRHQHQGKCFISADAAALKHPLETVLAPSEGASHAPLDLLNQIISPKKKIIPKESTTVLNRNAIEMESTGDCHRLMLQPGHSQPKRIFQAWLDDKKKDWKDRLQQQKIDCKINTDQTNATKAQHVQDWENMTIEQLEQFKKENEMHITKDAILEIEIFSHSVILMELWRDSIQMPRSAVRELEMFVSTSIGAIFGKTARKQNTPIKNEDAVKAMMNPIAKSRKNQKKGLEMKPKVKQSIATRNSNKQTLEASKYAKVRETPRKITPRFTTIEEEFMQTLSPSLEAIVKARGRKIKKLNVTVKWRIVDSQVLGRKRKEVGIEPVAEKLVDLSPRRKSPRLRNENTSKLFNAKEKIFAWDKGHLYNAKVIKRKHYIGCGFKYLVHFWGFKRSDDKWLHRQHMIKDNPSSRKFYKECRTWPLEVDEKVSPAPDISLDPSKNSTKAKDRYAGKRTMLDSDRAYSNNIVQAPRRKSPRLVPREMRARDTLLEDDEKQSTRRNGGKKIRGSTQVSETSYCRNH